MEPSKVQKLPELELGKVEMFRNHVYEIINLDSTTLETLTRSCLVASVGVLPSLR
jgi:hypothetical protein